MFGVPFRYGFLALYHVLRGWGSLSIANLFTLMLGALESNFPFMQNSSVRQSIFTGDFIRGKLKF
jgi:hypothetical protein